MARVSSWVVAIVLLSPLVVHEGSSETGDADTSSRLDIMKMKRQEILNRYSRSRQSKLRSSDPDEDLFASSSNRQSTVLVQNIRGGREVIKNELRTSGVKRRRLVVKGQPRNKISDLAAWKFLRQSEEQECVRRFICELGTGTVAADNREFQKVLKYLKQLNVLPPFRRDFQKELLPYVQAARGGLAHTDPNKCRLKYDCPATGAQLYTLFTILSANNL